MRSAAVTINCDVSIRHLLKFSLLQFLIDSTSGIAAGSDSWMLIVVDVMKWKDHWVAPQSVSGCGGSVKCLWGNTGQLNQSPVSPRMQHSHWMPSPTSLPFSLPLSVNHLRSMSFPPFCNRGGVHCAHHFFSSPHSLSPQPISPSITPAFQHAPRLTSLHLLGSYLLSLHQSPSELTAATSDRSVHASLSHRLPLYPVHGSFFFQKHWQWHQEGLEKWWW